MLEVVMTLTSVLGWLGVGLLTARSNEVLKQLIEFRLGNVDRAIQEIEKMADQRMRTVFELERKLLEFKAEISQDYVAREDWIRFATALDAKLDRLNAKLEALREKS